jgi:rhomboid protease GluP
MESSNNKFRFIVLPFLATAIGFSVLYTFFVWLLVTGSGIMPLNENLYRYGVPVFLSVIIVLAVLLPRFRKLESGGGKRSRVSLMFLVAVIAIATPTIFIQEYSRVSSDRLTSLKSIKAIEFNAPTRYYTAESYYLDKRHTGVAFRQETTGTLGEYAVLKIFVTTPMVAVRADTLSQEAPAWMCIEYEKQVSSLLGAEEKRKIFDEFVNQCNTEYMHKDFREAGYFRRADKGEENSRFSEAVSRNRSYRYNSNNFLIPVFEPFRGKRGSMLLWIFISFGLAAGALVSIVFKKKPWEETLPVMPVPSDTGEEQQEQESILDLLTPGEGFLVTPLIALINILMFVAMVCAGLGFMSFKPEDLVAWGANFQPYVTEGQWWRLVTCLFTHGGILDLVTSVYALVFIGLLLEPRIGKLKFILIYLVTGIVGACMSIWLNSDMVSGGSSVAIFGLYGAFFALLIGKSFRSGIRGEIIISVIFYTGYNILYGLNKGIFDFAILGSMLSGLLIGFPLLQWQNDNDTRQRRPVIVYLMAGWLLLLSVASLSFRHNPRDRFENMMTEFTVAEARALDNIDQRNDISASRMADTLEIRGIHDWQECLKITKRMDGIDNLPPELVAKRELLKKYCNYRIESCRLKATNLRTRRTNDTRMLYQYNSKIELIIQKLHGSDIPDSLLVIKPLAPIQPGVLYVIDGTPVTDSVNIPSYKIKSLTVLKPDEAMKIYGEKGFNGAIVITIK